MTGLTAYFGLVEVGQATRELAGWLQEGRLRSIEDVVSGGIEEFPATLNRLFHGGNTGKLVLELTRP